MTSRRTLFKKTAGLAAGASLLGSKLNADEGLQRLGFDDTLETLTGGDTTAAGDSIELKVPDQVSNGAFVTVSARVKLPSVEIMHLIIDNHAVSHVASMRPTRTAYFSLSIRIAQPCAVILLALTSDGWLRQDARINEVLAGCEV